MIKDCTENVTSGWKQIAEGGMNTQTETQIRKNRHANKKSEKDLKKKFKKAVLTHTA